MITAVRDRMKPEFTACLRALDANVIACETSSDRWTLLRDMQVAGDVLSTTNIYDPPTGSLPLGVNAYSQIAEEIAIQMRTQPTTIILPAARGDLAAGVQYGFDNNKIGRGPKFIITEPFPRVSAALAGHDYRQRISGSTAQQSITGDTVTYQSLEVLRRSGGSAITISDAVAAEWKRRSARQGIPCELASAGQLAAAELVALQAGGSEREMIVVIITSSAEPAQKAAAYLETGAWGA